MLKRWAVNDVPRGIPQQGTERPNNWLNQKVLQLIKEMKQAQHDADHARAKAMRAELTELVAELNIPLVHGAIVQVPNVTLPQKSAILRVMRFILRSTTLKAWEKQAIKKVMRVVRTSPHTVRGQTCNQDGLGQYSTCLHLHTSPGYHPVVW